MGFRKVSIRESTATSIAEISWYLESEAFWQQRKNLPMKPMTSLPN
ncbi:hypothetical protein SAMN05444682_101132 [Parapedobacter indicus]|uniref:Uncharacterized protein n=1 Tax=Parapedobacter indicus TaxID=1477437 RepID=A0A1I3CPR3_9SPHI|nr:hypothetical protein CLV26_101145 [Parapedobacter indicus]SFH76494.1 hypothetical protein SAMN05444682_101132 [Parapedobacter indicus]